MAEGVWRQIKKAAANELASGHRAAGNLEAVDWQKDPWRRAQYLVIRDGFVEQWQPKGAIELAMLDTMAQTFSEYLFWMHEAHRRATTDAIPQPSKTEREIAEKIRGEWIPPRVYEQEAIEYAAAMADRYNRLFLRTLRQMRDLRRYSVPVTINYPQQVNIAADGGQQVNVSQSNGKNEKQD